MTAGGFSQGIDFDQRSNNSKISKASKSGHKKKKPKGQRELDEDVSQLEEIISQQYGDDSRSAYSARGGNRMAAPAPNLGDKMKSHGSIEERTSKQKGFITGDFDMHPQKLETDMGMISGSLADAARNSNLALIQNNEENFEGIDLER